MEGEYESFEKLNRWIFILLLKQLLLCTYCSYCSAPASCVIIIYFFSGSNRFLSERSSQSSIFPFLLLCTCTTLISIYFCFHHTDWTWVLSIFFQPSCVYTCVILMNIPRCKGWTHGDATGWEWDLQTAFAPHSYKRRHHQPRDLCYCIWPNNSSFVA